MTFNLPVVIDGKTFRLKELTFNDYKNFCKTLMSLHDAKDINDAFNDLLSYCCDNTKNIDALTKLELLLAIRSLTLGKEIKLMYNKAEITIDVDFLRNEFASFDKTLTSVIDNATYVFSVPYNFYTAQDSISIISECLVSYNGVNLANMLPDEKLSFLPGLPVVDLIKQIANHCEKISIKVKSLDNMQLSLCDGTFVHFLKFIFEEKIDAVLDLEYSLRKQLGYTSVDFLNVSYPEAKIMLNKLIKDSGKSEKQ